MRIKRSAILILAVIALASFYVSGRLDHALYNVGLNYHECARNGFGATFCGAELNQYRARVQRVQEQAARAGREAREQVEAASQ